MSAYPVERDAAGIASGPHLAVTRGSRGRSYASTPNGPALLGGVPGRRASRAPGEPTQDGSLPGRGLAYGLHPLKRVPAKGWRIAAPAGAPLEAIGEGRARNAGQASDRPE
jgi:hypothetical protein